MNLFGWKINEPSENKPSDPNSTEACPHLVLMPRWDKNEDIGHDDRISAYRCDACGATLSLEEERDLRRHHAITL